MTTLPLPMMPSSSPLIPVIVTPLPKTTTGSTYTLFSCKLPPTHDVHL